MKFSQRKWKSSLLLIVFSVFVWIVWRICRIGFGPTDVYTGAALLGLTLFLALFNLRKKIPFIPLLRASTWMQIHIYLGLFSVVLFLLHAEFRIPSGVLETVLAVVFLIVAVSGMIGLYLSRKLPSLMNQSGQSANYENIPKLRKRISDEVHQLIIKAEEECQSSTIPEFYFGHLRAFLESYPSVMQSLGSEKKRLSHRLTNELEARLRYLSDDEKLIAVELEEWIKTKENLDFQYASQRILKGWLFIHIPFTWSLILLGVVHGVFALLYGGNN